MNAPHFAPDYRTCMQGAAHAYLLRHRAEYLADSGRLFSSAEHHLVVALELPASLAEKLVYLAWNDLLQAERTPHQVSNTL